MMRARVFVQFTFGLMIWSALAPAEGLTLRLNNDGKPKELQVLSMELSTDGAVVLNLSNSSIVRVANSVAAKHLMNLKGLGENQKIKIELDGRSGVVTPQVIEATLSQDDFVTLSEITLLASGKDGKTGSVRLESFKGTLKPLDFTHTSRNGGTETVIPEIVLRPLPEEPDVFSDEFTKKYLLNCPLHRLAPK